MISFLSGWVEKGRKYQKKGAVSLLVQMLRGEISTFKVIALNKVDLYRSEVPEQVQNFREIYEAAGYKVIDNLGFKTVEEGVDAALNAGANLVVICSSDDEYAEYAIPAFKYLDGRAMFIVAGAPACMEDLKAAGIENFIHVKCNVLETLKEYNAKLGI